MIEGQCLCGAFTVQTQKLKPITACHCASCRKWSGGVLLSVDGGNEVSFSGEDCVSTYSSSDWAERAFCSTCGSSLYFKMKASNHYFLMAGLFGKNDLPTFEEQQYIDEKPDCYSFTEATQNVTKKEMEKLLADFLDRFQT